RASSARNKRGGRWWRGELPALSKDHPRGLVPARIDRPPFPRDGVRDPGLPQTAALNSFVVKEGAIPHDGALADVSRWRGLTPANGADGAAGLWPVDAILPSPTALCF